MKRYAAAYKRRKEERIKELSTYQDLDTLLKRYREAAEMKNTHRAGVEEKVGEDLRQYYQNYMQSKGVRMVGDPLPLYVPVVIFTTHGKIPIEPSERWEPVF